MQPSTPRSSGRPKRALVRGSCFALIGIAAFLAGCTAIRVQTFATSELRPSHVCIRDNPAVVVPGFLSAVHDGFDRHGVSTEMYGEVRPDHCAFTLFYTARQSWDLAPYLSHAELEIRHSGERVAYAEYHLRGKGGYSMMKWQDAKTKMDPVIDQLLGAAR